jgi:hypothetical protein
MTTPERRFDEAEVAAIFERATAREASGGRQLVPTGERGLTLGQLQDIGREIGVAPDAIADAVAALAHGGRTATRRFLGVPVGVEHIVPLPRRLTDEEWERLVVALREVFDARGVVKQEGSLRHWRNGNLQALLEPTEGAQRIRLRTFKGDAPGMITGGLAISGVTGIGLVSAMLTGAAASDVGMASALAVAAVGGAAMLGLTVLRQLPWARRRREQMAEVAARAASLARIGPQDSRPALAPPPDA